MPFNPRLFEQAPWLVRVLRRFIVSWGQGRSAATIIAVSLLLSLGMTASIRLASGLPMTMSSAVISMTVPLVIAGPMVWLTCTLIGLLDRSERAHQDLASRDNLTQVWSRREFFERADALAERARRNGLNSWLMMIDLDRFKQINDGHGHLVGDMALRRVAQICEAAARTDHLIGRFGGDEFTALVLATDEHSAYDMAESVRKHIETTPLRLADGKTVQLTASLGFTDVQDAPEALHAALGRADRALLRAKALGRNRVERALAERAMAADVPEPEHA